MALIQGVFTAILFKISALVLFSQRTTKAEIVDKFSGKTPCTRATILTKCNVRFFEKFQENHPVAERQVLKKCTVLSDWHITLFSFLVVFRAKKDQKVTFLTKF